MSSLLEADVNLRLKKMGTLSFFLYFFRRPWNPVSGFGMSELRHANEDVSMSKSRLEQEAWTMGGMAGQEELGVQYGGVKPEEEKLLDPGLMHVRDSQSNM